VKADRATDPRRASAESEQRTVNTREVVKGVMYVLSTGCPCEGGGRCIAKDLPPRNTVNAYFCQWGYDGTREKMHDALYVKCRGPAERAASPSGCIVESQSVKSAGKGRRPLIRMDLMRAS
jgi:transposase